MKILFDLSALQGDDRVRGIGRWAKNFLNEFVKQNNAQIDIHFLITDSYMDEYMKIKCEFQDVIKDKNIHLYHALPSNIFANTSADFAMNRFNIEIKKEYIRRISPDVFFNFHLGCGLHDKTTVHLDDKKRSYTAISAIYDFIPNEFPKEFLVNEQSKKYNKSYLKELKNQDYLISISEYTKEQAIKILSFDHTKVVSVGTGISNKFTLSKPTKGAINPKIFSKVKKEFLFSVGVFEWRKNFDSILKAMSHLDKKKYKELELVLVSPFPTELSAHYENLAKKHKIKLHLFYGVTDEELNYLYKNCKLFIFPSISEGFGLPVLESVSSGALCLCSSKTSIPEVLGYDQTYIFDPKKPKHVAKKIETFLSMSEADIQRHKKEQQKLISVHTWKNAVTKFNNLLKKLEIKPNNDISINSRNDLNFAKKIIKKINLQESNLVIQAAEALTKNFPSRKNYLLLDITILCNIDSKTGIQRVVRNTVWHLLSRKFENYEVKLFSASSNQAFIENNFELHMRSFLSKPDFKYTNYRDKEIYIPKKGDKLISLDLHHDFWIGNILLANNLKALGVEFLTVIYDLLPILKPDWFADGVPQVHKQYINSSILFGDVVSISRTTSNDAHRYYNDYGSLNRKNRSLYSFIFGGASDTHLVDSLSNNEKIRKIYKNQIFKDCFVVIGTIEPRKGHDEIFSAFNDLWKKGSDEKLLFIGKQGWKVEKLIAKFKGNKNYNKKFFIENDINDVELDYILSNSKAMIFGSKGEGLGLPLIEAGAKNISIISRKIDVLEEVAGQDASYFEDKQTLKNLIENFEPKKSKAISERVTWDISSEKLAQIIEGNFQEDYVINSSNNLDLSKNFSTVIKKDKSGYAKIQDSNINELVFHGSYHHLEYGEYVSIFEIESEYNSRIKLQHKINFGNATSAEKLFSLKKDRINKFEIEINVNNGLWSNCEFHILNLSKINSFKIKKLHIRRINE